MSDIQQLFPIFPGVFPLRDVVVSRDEMVAFAEAFDRQPFHIDEDAAKETLLGGLAASAWYTCAKISSSVEAVARELGVDAQIAGLEQVLLIAPVRAGDRLSGAIQLGAIEACGCGYFITRGRIDINNQNGVSVMRLIVELFLQRSNDVHVGVPIECKLRRSRPARAQRKAREDVIRYFDEIGIGDEALLGPYSFDTGKVEEFGMLTGNAPTLANSGEHHLLAEVLNWHLPAAWMQCMLRYYSEQESRFSARGEVVPLLGPAAGVKDLRWVKPVRVGETITFRGWAERKLEIASHNDWGLLVVGAEGVNSDGEVVVSFCPQMLIQRAGAVS